MTQTAEWRRLVRLAGSMNRRAERAGVHGRLNASQLWMVETYQTTCHYCGIKLEAGTFDHVVPFDKGGANSYLNLVRCCLTCNRTKYTKSPEQLVKHLDRVVNCEICGKAFRPRWAEYEAGRARICSRSCSAKKRWRSASA